MPSGQDRAAVLKNSASVVSDKKPGQDQASQLSRMEEVEAHRPPLQLRGYLQLRAPEQVKSLVSG